MTWRSAAGRGGVPRPPVGILGLVILCGLHAAAHAEFHTWVDAGGQRHVSSVPARGVRPDGSLHDAYNPNSIVFQHARMRAALRRAAARDEPADTAAPGAEPAALPALRPADQSAGSLGSRRTK